MWVAAITIAWLAEAVGSGSIPVRLLLFGATLTVEILAFVAALSGRRALARKDRSRAAFSAISLGLGLRLIAEVRLLLLYLEAVPSFVLDDPMLWNIYFFGLRYLYTVADLALLVGFLRTLLALGSTGLGFRARTRDLLLASLLVALPVAVHALQVAFTAGTVDPNIFTFRLLAASVGALVSGVCVVLASAALQMGGGAWAWIWGAAAVGGIARALAFVAAAAAPLIGGTSGILIEQSLLWTFACAWLLAMALHRRLLRAR
jgi:hypothetical protein